MRKSIYKKLVLIFVGIMLISNLITFSALEYTSINRMRGEIKNDTVRISNQIRDIYVNKHVGKNSIEDLLKGSYFNVKFYSGFKEIEKDKQLLKYVNINSLRKIEHFKEDSIRLRLNTKAPLELSMIINKVNTIKAINYFVVYPDIRKSLFGVRRLILRVNMISIIIGIIITLFAAKFIIKPIEILKSATHRVSEGDFDIVVPNNRKDEIGQLIDDFNMMVRELKGIEILRKDFVTAVSHEFKTPLTSIEGYTKLLKNSTDEEREEYIKIITEETRRLSNLSSNILLLNRIENDNLVMRHETFRLDEQIRHVILLLENKWSKEDIHLDIDLDEILFEGNEQLLYQVWLNLFDNAVKFSRKQGKIELNLKRGKGGAVEFYIRDYGKGIAAEQQSRVFEKFYKGDKARNNEGNGLGLSIVKKIIEMHGGKILIKSEIDKGTTVHVELLWRGL